MERKTTVMNVDDFINEYSEPMNNPIDEYYRREYEAVMNDIDNLYEDGYKELYLKKCADYEDLLQQFDYELKRNEDLVQIVAAYQHFVKDSEIIDEVNEFIKIRQKRIARVIERGKRRNEKATGKI